MASNWKEAKLKDVALINPAESLKKGQLSKKIPMDGLLPFCKKIPGYLIEKYNGGTKFRNGDTIMARITPCLENGKTAKVDILDNDEIGFGSTEYIVFRAIENETDSDYLYYLITSSQIREPAIKSMVGSSGRQRVQTDVVKDLNIMLPPLETQQKIAKVLGTLDDKIELNNSINNNLEQQAQAIFKSWFVDFEPFGGTMPDDWETGCLGDISNITNGKRPSLKSNNKTDDAVIPLIGASSIMGYTNKVLYNEEILVTGRVGTHGIIQKINYPCWTSDNTLVITSKFYEFVYQALKGIDYSNLNRGSTQPLITQTDLKKIDIIIPNIDTLNRFEKTINSLTKIQNQLRIENEQLTNLRDTLLPKLMSGEIDVSKVEINEILESPSDDKLSFSEK